MSNSATAEQALGCGTERRGPGLDRGREFDRRKDDRDRQ